MNIFYRLGDKVYINLTNSCPNDCVFCIRQLKDSVGDADTLWLPRDPELHEIKTAFDAFDLQGMTEIVFCGYGDPMERADIVLEICYYIREKTALPIRINTCGAVNLSLSETDIRCLEIADSVSVSLTAADAKEYLRLTQSKHGEAAYQAMLDFARKASTVTKVYFSVVDVIGPENIEKCRKIADSMGIPLRVRATDV